MKFPQDFQKAISFILNQEGGYSNHPNDPGKATKYGITQAEVPEMDVKKLTKTRAKEIYFERYYQPMVDLFELYEFPEKARFALTLLFLDSSINLGLSRTIKLLQATLNDFLSIKLEVDGKFGPKTKRAFCSAMPSFEAFLIAFMATRLYFYTKLAKRKRMRVFLRGWVNRCSALMTYLAFSL